MKRRRKSSSLETSRRVGNGVASGLLIPFLAALAAAAIGIGAAGLKLLKPPPPPTPMQSIVETLGTTRKPL